jgi:flagellar basal body-associated protein FliL
MEYILWGFVIVLLCIMTVLLIAATVFLVRVMRDISKDMPKVDLPNPIQEYAEQQAKKQAKKKAKAEQDKIETILKNIENYDGTGFGQLDVPRG